MSAIDVIEGVVTAAATALIAIYTIVLARVSKRQGELIEKQLQLAREEFIATHRPRLILRKFQLLNEDRIVDEDPRIIFIGQNIGDSLARDIEVRSATLVIDVKQNLSNTMSFPNVEKMICTLSSGQSEVFPANGATPVEQADTPGIYHGTKLLVVLGTVAYLDEIGTRRETGFCRVWEPVTKKWGVWEGSEYEYEF